jgi:BMFP domain-containing protein YqiC
MFSESVREFGNANKWYDSKAWEMLGNYVYDGLMSFLGGKKVAEGEFVGRKYPAEQVPENKYTFGLKRWIKRMFNKKLGEEEPIKVQQSFNGNPEESLPYYDWQPVDWRRVGQIIDRQIIQNRQFGAIISAGSSFAGVAQTAATVGAVAGTAVNTVNAMTMSEDLDTQKTKTATLETKTATLETKTKTLETASTSSTTSTDLTALTTRVTALETKATNTGAALAIICPQIESSTAICCVNNLTNKLFCSTGTSNSLALTSANAVGITQSATTGTCGTSTTVC